LRDVDDRPRDPLSAEQVIAAHRAAGRFFAAAGIRSFVREQGDGEAVLCIHGVPASSFLYRKVLPALAARGLRGIAFDLPGLGLADRPRGFSYTWSDLGLWSAAAVDALALDRFHLLAHDFGGPVAFELCALRAPQIQSLTILDTMVDVDRFRRPRWIEALIRPTIGQAIIQALPRRLWRRIMLRVGIQDPSTITADELDAWLILLRGGDHGRALIEMLRNSETTTTKRDRYRRAVTELDTPKQIIWGSEDPILPLQTEGERIRTLTGAPLHPVLAKHFLQEDQYEAIATRVADLAAKGRW